MNIVVNPWNLTPRQVEIISLLTEAKAAKTVAYELGISRHTLETTMQRVKRRMGIRSTIGVILEWDRWARKAA